MCRIEDGLVRRTTTYTQLPDGTTMVRVEEVMERMRPYEAEPAWSAPSGQGGWLRRVTLTYDRDGCPMRPRSSE